MIIISPVGHILTKFTKLSGAYKLWWTSQSVCQWVLRPRPISLCWSPLHIDHLMLIISHIDQHPCCSAVVITHVDYHLCWSAPINPHSMLISYSFWPSHMLIITSQWFIITSFIYSPQVDHHPWWLSPMLNHLFPVKGKSCWPWIILTFWKHPINDIHLSPKHNQPQKFIYHSLFTAFQALTKIRPSCWPWAMFIFLNIQWQICPQNTTSHRAQKFICPSLLIVSHGRPRCPFNIFNLYWLSICLNPVYGITPVDHEVYLFQKLPRLKASWNCYFLMTVEF